MNRTTLLKATVATAALTFATGAAMAADAPVYEKGPTVAPVAAAAPVWNWTGFYAGVNAGYGWGNIETDSGSFFDSGDEFDLDADGGIVGGQVGYNWQMDNFVFGLETDMQYAHLSSEDNNPFDFDGDGTYDDSAGVGAELNWLGTTRLRAGVAMDRFLVYATGGLAYGDADVGYTFNGSNDVQDVIADEDSTRVGYAVGAGVEGAITDHVTAKIEYLYTDLGDQDSSYRYTDATGAPGTISTNTDFEAHIVRAGLNYKF